METLGLSTAKIQEDGLFRRLFWPTISNQYDVDLIGRRGFWLATVVGVISCVAMSLQGSWLIGLLVLIVFLLGAAGIRQRSVAASAFVLGMYALGILGSWMTALLGYGTTGNPFIGIVSLMLLCANLRATIVSQRWVALGVDRDFPAREDGVLVDALVNKFPEKFWVKGRYMFFTLASAYITLTLLGFLAIALRSHAVRSHSQPEPFEIRAVPDPSR